MKYLTRVVDAIFWWTVYNSLGNLTIGVCWVLIALWHPPILDFILAFYIGASCLRLTQVIYEKTSEGVRGKVWNRRE